MRYVTIAKFEGYEVVEPFSREKYINQRKQRESKRKKTERKQNIQAMFVGAACAALPVLMCFGWLLGF